MAALDGISAAILAGGLGTRLRPVVADRPKVLAPVGGRPFLAYLLEQLRRAGLREAVLLVGHAADQVRGTFGDDYHGTRLIYSEEPQPLGTGGALRLAVPHFAGETILLLNGDSYCDADLPAFAAFHRARGNAASLALAAVPDTSRYGRVQVDSDGRVVRFEEKGGDRGPGWINAGVYLIQRDRLDDIAADRPVSLERDTLPAWVAGGRVGGFPAGRFIDIGTPESYAAADAFFGTAPGVE